MIVHSYVNVYQIKIEFFENMGFSIKIHCRKVPPRYESLPPLLPAQLEVESDIVLSLMTDWAGEFPEHLSQKNMPSTGPVYVQILTLYKSLLPYIYILYYIHTYIYIYIILYIYIYIFPLYQRVSRASKPHKPGRCWIRNKLWQKMASSSWYWYTHTHIYIYMVQRRPAPPNGDGCSVLLLMVPFPCGLWWWGVWDVGDGWPGLLLMVPPLPPCALWWWGVCMFVCLYVCKYVSM